MNQTNLYIYETEQMQSNRTVAARTSMGDVVFKQEIIPQVPIEPVFTEEGEMSDLEVVDAYSAPYRDSLGKLINSVGYGSLVQKKRLPAMSLIQPSSVTVHAHQASLVDRNLRHTDGKAKYNAVISYIDGELLTKLDLETKTLNKQFFLRDILSLISDFHYEEMFHQDLHCANLLLQVDSGNNHIVTAIDASSVTHNKIPEYYYMRTSDIDYIRSYLEVTGELFANDGVNDLNRDEPDQEEILELLETEGIKLKGMKKMSRGQLYSIYLQSQNNGLMPKGLCDIYGRIMDGEYHNDFLQFQQEVAAIINPES